MSHHLFSWDFAETVWWTAQIFWCLQNEMRWITVYRFWAVQVASLRKQKTILEDLGIQESTAKHKAYVCVLQILGTIDTKFIFTSPHVEIQNQNHRQNNYSNLIKNPKLSTAGPHFIYSSQIDILWITCSLMFSTTKTSNESCWVPLPWWGAFTPILSSSNAFISWLTEYSYCITTSLWER